ncbi:hypothetical protein GCK32_000955 [Trichostrongylus colubriformis]|uniref:G-protein coupled receptors family 1 profile domain-containing protein n=1 Tax=Trichostrongylus colubriformis TaxID=6319 RepID=A0AAN8F0N4_TRICO
MELPWPQVIFIAATMITLPLHIAVLILVMRRRKFTPFHVLVISQGIADVFSLINYFLVNSLRVSQLCNEFFWINRELIANYEFRSIYFSMYLRNTGIALMSLQRYICICQTGAKINRIISRMSPVIFAMLQWGIGLLMVLPLCQPSFNVTYEMRATLEPVLVPSLLSLANTILLTSSTVLLATCIICYVLILNFIQQNSLQRTESTRHEVRLCGQIAGLVLAFSVQFMYNGGLYILNSFGQMTVIRSWRMMGPLVYGFLSCVHPWTCLAFNKEIRDGILAIFRYCFGNKEGTISPAIFTLSSRSRSE